MAKPRAQPLSHERDFSIIPRPVPPPPLPDLPCSVGQNRREMKLGPVYCSNSAGAMREPPKKLFLKFLKIFFTVSVATDVGVELVASV